MGAPEEFQEIADAIGDLAERVADLTLDALRSQAQGEGDAKATERALSSARRSLVKAEQTLRGLSRN